MDRSPKTNGLVLMPEMIEAGVDVYLELGNDGREFSTPSDFVRMIFVAMAEASGRSAHKCAMRS